MQVTRSAPHGDKLKALLVNSKLPQADRPRVEAAITKYEAWVTTLRVAQGEGQTLLSTLVAALVDYKRYVEFDLIFDAADDFLYRQKGQLKLDNSVLEEFLPYIFDVRLIPGIGRLDNVNCGPQSSFAGLSFGSPFLPLIPNPDEDDPYKHKSSYPALCRASTPLLQQPAVISGAWMAGSSPAMTA